VAALGSALIAIGQVLSVLCAGCCPRGVAALGSSLIAVGQVSLCFRKKIYLSFFFVGANN
jgi:hypothetical protein